MNTFVFCSFKGGTSKTSTCMHVGAHLAKKYGKKVLLIDFDGQANLSTGLGLGLDQTETMVSVLHRTRTISEVIQKTYCDNLYIVPANAYLDGIERVLAAKNDPYLHERLRKSLVEVEDKYDFCFIDTPPSLGWLTQSAFFGAQHSVICAVPEAYSILALRKLKEFHASIEEHHHIAVFGVTLSFWDERGALNKKFLEDITGSFPNLAFQAKIRRDISVSRAVLAGKTVFDFDPNCRSAKDYEALGEEFLQRVKGLSHV